MNLFRKNKTICQVAKDEGESYEHFLNRVNFILSQNPTNEEEYNKTVLYSHIYINVKILKCKYNEIIMKQLANMISKID